MGGVGSGSGSDGEEGGSSGSSPQSPRPGLARRTSKLREREREREREASGAAELDELLTRVQRLTNANARLLEEMGASSSVAGAGATERSSTPRGGSFASEDVPVSAAATAGTGAAVSPYAQPSRLAMAAVRSRARSRSRSQSRTDVRGDDEDDEAPKPPPLDL